MDSTPGEIEKAIAPPSVDRWSPEVELAVAASDHVNVELPPCRGGVAGYQVERFPPHLYSDVDAVEQGAVPIAEPRTRKVETLDDDSHLPQLGMTNASQGGSHFPETPGAGHRPRSWESLAGGLPGCRLVVAAWKCHR